SIHESMIAFVLPHGPPGGFRRVASSIQSAGSKHPRATPIYVHPTRNGGLITFGPCSRVAGTRPFTTSLSKSPVKGRWIECDVCLTSATLQPSGCLAERPCAAG